MSDLKSLPFGPTPTPKSWLFRLYELITLPFTIYFILGSPRVDPSHGLTMWRRFRLGWRMYRNSRRVFTGISYRAHLAMAVKLFEFPAHKEGVVVECGCFRGGTTANLSLACQAAGRRLIVYDSFEGLPAATSESDLQYATSTEAGYLSAQLDQVKAHVERYGAPEVCTFVKGWFADTLPHHEPRIALMFLDVDLPSSLHDCIINLWPKLLNRGLCFIDEWIFNDYCALFWSEKYWAKYFNRKPPGLIGSGSGLSLGGFYLGGGFNQVTPFTRPASIAYTRKIWTGHWTYYPDEEQQAPDQSGQ